MCSVALEHLSPLRRPRLLVVFVGGVEDLEGVLRQLALAGLLLVVLPTGDTRANNTYDIYAHTKIGTLATSSAQDNPEKKQAARQPRNKASDDTASDGKQGNTCEVLGVRVASLPVDTCMYHSGGSLFFEAS